MTIRDNWTAKSVIVVNMKYISNWKSKRKKRCIYTYTGLHIIYPHIYYANEWEDDFMKKIVLTTYYVPIYVYIHCFVRGDQTKRVQRTRSNGPEKQFQNASDFTILSMYILLLYNILYCGHRFDIYYSLSELLFKYKS